MDDQSDDGAWFAAKRFGYGSGPPIAWQGWVFMVAHIAVLAGIAATLHSKPLAFAIAMFAAGLMPLPVYAAKTRGGWRWRG